MAYYGIFKKKTQIPVDIYSFQLNKSHFVAKASDVKEETINFSQEELRKLIYTAESIIDAEIGDKYGTVKFSSILELKESKLFLELIENPNNRIISLTMRFVLNGKRITMRIFEDGIVGFSPPMSDEEIKNLFIKFFAD